MRLGLSQVSESCVESLPVFFINYPKSITANSSMRETSSENPFQDGLKLFAYWHFRPLPYMFPSKGRGIYSLMLYMIILCSEIFDNQAMKVNYALLQVSFDNVECKMRLRIVQKITCPKFKFKDIFFADRS